MDLLTKLSDSLLQVPQPPLSPRDGDHLALGPVEQELGVAVRFEQSPEDALVLMPLAMETPVIVPLEQPGDDLAVAFARLALDLLL